MRRFSTWRRRDCGRGGGWQLGLGGSVAGHRAHLCCSGCRGEGCVLVFWNRASSSVSLALDCLASGLASAGGWSV